MTDFKADPVEFAELNLDANQCLQAIAVLGSMARHQFADKQLRSAIPPAAKFRQLLEVIAQRKLQYPDDAKEFFLAHFSPFRIRPNGNLKGFVTGYFEPQVMAASKESLQYSYPILSRPLDAQKRFRSRSEIDLSLDEYHVIAWVRDPIEAFMIQVQGSAVLHFLDGRKRRLIFNGRNGRPYSSIGRTLIECGEITPSAMSIKILKDWVRRSGQRIGEKGRNLLWRNESYVFFRLSPYEKKASGPIGGAGVALTPLVSLATDRKIWPYATPLLIRGDLSSVKPDWIEFQQLMVSQDTGAAIVGPARGDIFLGTGEDAGIIASRIRHDVDFIAFLPR